MHDFTSTLQFYHIMVFSKMPPFQCLQVGSLNLEISEPWILDYIIEVRLFVAFKFLYSVLRFSLKFSF